MTVRALASIAVFGLVLGGAVRASRAEERPPRWSGSLEFAAMFSPADGERRDVGGWAAIVPRFHWTVRPDIALTIGIAIPIPPLIAFHAPVGLEWSPRGPRRGPLLRAQVRPLWSSVDLCGAGGDCPLNDAADPYDRGGSMVGGAFDVGATYRWMLGAWSLEVGAGYVIGGFDGRSGKTETALDGVYQGFAVELGVLR